jgi:hypothetical protein
MMVVAVVVNRGSFLLFSGEITSSSFLSLTMTVVDRQG